MSSPASPAASAVFTIGAADALRGVSLDAVLAALAAAAQRVLDLEERLALALGDQKKLTTLRGERPARPEVGTRVVLGRSDQYLLDNHGAALGSVGTVVEHSGLRADDDGVLVDWGSGGRVRCNLDELSWTTAPVKPYRIVPGLLPGTRALHCLFCLTKVQGTGRGSASYITRHAEGIHQVEVLAPRMDGA